VGWGIAMAKYHVELTETVRAPKEKVFAAATDYESMPRWSKFYTSVRITKREGNVVNTEVQTKAFGVTATGTSKMVELSPERIEMTGEGKNSNSKVVLTFDQVPDGTKLVYIADMEAHGAMSSLLGPFAKGKIESLLREEGKAFAKYAEQLK
jgi:uncharacterized protein YndB with AHSA1/START domain